MYETDGAHAVTAIGVSHRYGNRTALDDVSFDVLRGSVVGLVGANGSGKSTLLRIIAGVTRPTNGSLAVGGAHLGAESSGKGIGAAIDGMSLWPAWTVERNLRYLGGLAGVTPSAVDAAAQMTGIAGEMRTKLRRLSLGNRQRVSIAAAVLCGTHLVLLDEPMNGLDPDARHRTRDLILELAGRERTVVFSSHDLHDVETVCRELIVLEAGRLAFAGPVESYAEQLTVVAIDVADRDSGRAAAVLTSASCRWWADRSGLPVVPLVDAPSAERALVRAGIPITRMDRRSATLEERFDARR